MRSRSRWGGRAVYATGWSFLAATAAWLGGAGIARAAEEQAAVVEPESSVAVFVQLQGDPAALRFSSALQAAKTAGGGANSVMAKAATAGAVRAQIVQNEQEQQAFEAALAQRLGASRGRSAGPEVLYRATKSLNGIAYRVDPSMLEALRAMPGVKQVRMLQPEYPSLATGVPTLGTAAAWAGANAVGVTGQGVRIGIIDTGVDYQHATFGGTGVLADYQANNRTVAPDAYFPNARVVGGVDLAGDAYTGSNAPAPDSDPMDCNGHGTHVASTAAGGGVNADSTPYTGPYDGTTAFNALKLGPGMAPQASVYGIRVFGCSGGTLLTVPGIEWALDPNGDGDFSDHLDVINMSLGTSFGRLTDASAAAADNAASMGIVVVASAGNNGDTYTVAGSPGSGSRVITVAATERNTSAVLTVNTPASIAGSSSGASASMVDGSGNAVPISELAGEVVLALDASDANGTLTTDACSPLTNAAAVSGKIALADRGTCTFATKYQNARDAGAVGLLIANNVAGAPGGMSGNITGLATMPVMQISQTLGDSIKTQLTANEVVNVSFKQAFALGSFSSRGPRAGLDGVKPDVAAPGVSVVAAQTGVIGANSFAGGSNNLTLSGTSMAAPHVAGMMALLKERFPASSVEELKAVVMNTALRDVFRTTGLSVRAGVDLVGAGVIDPVRAVQSTVTAVNDDEPEAVSLGFFGEVLGSDTRTKRLRLTNHGTTAETFTLDFDIANDAPGMDFLLPGGNSVTVPAGSSVTVDVQVRSTAALMHHVRDATAAATQSIPSGVQAWLAGWGVLNRFYLTNKSGYVTLSQAGQVMVRTPIYAALRPASKMQATTPVLTAGATTGSSALTLAGQQVCTGTLVAGTACNGALPQTDVSRVSPFEWQVDNPKNTAIEPYTNIKQAGVAYDGTVLRFGVSMWGDWGGPSDVTVKVYIDANNDGVWERVLFNSNLGSMGKYLLNVNVAEQDTFVSVVGTLDTSSSMTTLNLPTNASATYLNGRAGNDVNTVVWGNNTMVLGATPAALGITPGNRFAYKVETCRGFNPNCRSANGTALDAAAGPYRWNTSEQGLNFGSTGPLTPDLDGGTLPVTWNKTHLSTNQSLGAMLIHHHNVQGERVQTLPVIDALATDLALDVTAAPATQLIGQNVTLTLTVNNLGGYDTTGVSVNALLPAGLTYVSDNGAGAYDSSTGVWTVGALVNGASGVLKIVARVDAVGSISGSFAVSGAMPDQVSTNNVKPFGISGQALSADLSISQTLLPASPTVGQNVTVKLIAANGGPNAASSVAVSAPLPADFAYVSDTGGGAYNPTTGVWTIGTLANSGTATLEIVAKANAVGTASTMTSTIGSAVADPMPGNNTATNGLSVQALSADLSIAQAFSTTAPKDGDNVTVTLTARNAGPDTAAAVSVSAPLPAGWAWVSDSGAGAYQSATGVWSVGNLASGASATLQIVAQAKGVGSKAFQSSISSTVVDPAANNNMATDTLTVQALAPAQTSFTLSNALLTSGAVRTGDSVSFTLRLQNTGSTALQGVSLATLVDFVASAAKQSDPQKALQSLAKAAGWSSAVTLASAVASSGTFDNQTGVWTVPSIAAGSAQTLTLTLVAPQSAGQLTLTANVSAGNAASATQSASVQVQAAAVVPVVPVEPAPVPGTSNALLVMMALALAALAGKRLRR